MHRVAVLDDYQSAAAEFADWSRVPQPLDVVTFPDHLDVEDAVAERLAPFDVVVVMRERTPFPRSLLDRLPNLRLLVTTGARNAAIDLAAARERGVTVCRTYEVFYREAVEDVAAFLVGSPVRVLRAD
ncbi:hypothetical protein ACI789_02690 [Geodermatophilus sp. SYSU D00965]